MKLEYTDRGGLVIRDITPEAWCYISQERRRAGSPYSWYFSHEVVDGAVYVADKILMCPEVLKIFDNLEKYGCMIPNDMRLLFNCIRYRAQEEIRFRIARAECEDVKSDMRQFRKILDRGCYGCNCLCVEMEGDDEFFYCIFGGKKKLAASPLCFEHGEFDPRTRQHYFGQKIYPQSGCQYLIKGE